MSTVNVETEYREEPKGNRESRERYAAQVRDHANKYELRQLDLTTADTNTLTAIYLSDEMRTDSAALLSAQVIGQSDDGTIYAAYGLTAMFRRIGNAAAAQQGATQTLSAPIESNAALDCTLGVDSDSRMFVKVSDGSVGTVDWRCWVEVRRL